MAPVSFYDFKRLDGVYPATFDLPLKDGNSLRLVKFDEDAEQGYGYSINIVINGVEREEFSGYYSSFGMEERGEDVIHPIRNYLVLAGY